MEKKLHNLLACARIVGVPATWLKEQAKAGNVPCLRIGKRKLFFNINAVRSALENMAANGDAICAR
jgi:hypothetical protein